MKNWTGMKEVFGRFHDMITEIEDNLAGSKFEVSASWPDVSLDLILEVGSFVSRYRQAQESAQTNIVRASADYIGGGTINVLLVESSSSCFIQIRLEKQI